MNKIKYYIIIFFLFIFTYTFTFSYNEELKVRLIKLENQIKNQENGIKYINKIDTFLYKKDIDFIVLNKIDNKLLTISEKIKDYNSKRALDVKIILEYFSLRIWRQIEIIEERNILEAKERKKISKHAKSVYFTTYSSVSSNKIKNLLNLVKNTEINSVTIDIKEVDWYVAFDMSEYNFWDIKPVTNNRIKDPKKLLKMLHDNWIYTIARVVVFKDKLLSERRPDLAIKWSTDKNEVWTDYKGNKYLDASSKDVRDYIINISNAAQKVWFDEINFDYVRFPSDWKISKTFYPFSNKILSEKWTQWKIAVMDKFSNYITTELRKKHSDIVLSADVFWLVTRWDMLQIWQNLESFLIYFDFVWPMVYPSHYWANFLWFSQPDNYPYEVLKDSIDQSNLKIDKLNEEIKLAKIEKRKIKINETLTTDISLDEINQIEKSKIRLWLQGFSCTRCSWATPYNRTKFRKQISAIEDSWLDSFWVWNSSSNYYYDWYNNN